MKRKPRKVEAQDFTRFLAWLDPDPERAGKVYNTLHRKLVIYFAAHGCGAQAEDLASWALDRAAEKFTEGGSIEDREPGPYVRRVAHYIRLEHWEENARIELLEVEPVDEREDKGSERGCEEECLAGLPAEDRHLLMDYYVGQRKGERKHIRVDIAGDLGVSANTLRQRAKRVKDRLVNCVKECQERGLASPM